MPWWTLSTVPDSFLSFPPFSSSLSLFLLPPLLYLFSPSSSSHLSIPLPSLVLRSHHDLSPLRARATSFTCAVRLTVCLRRRATCRKLHDWDPTLLQIRLLIESFTFSPSRVLRALVASIASFAHRAQRLRRATTPFRLSGWLLRVAHHHICLGIL